MLMPIKHKLRGSAPLHPLPKPLKRSIKYIFLQTVSSKIVVWCVKILRQQRALQKHSKMLKPELPGDLPPGCFAPTQPGTLRRSRVPDCPHYMQGQCRAPHELKLAHMQHWLYTIGVKLNWHFFSPYCDSCKSCVQCGPILNKWSICCVSSEEHFLVVH